MADQAPPCVSPLRRATSGLPPPKGICSGRAGCGKSLDGQGGRRSNGTPLLRLDVGKIMGGLVGSSEENIRKALKTAEAVARRCCGSMRWKRASPATARRICPTAARPAACSARSSPDAGEDLPVFVIATANDAPGAAAGAFAQGPLDEILRSICLPRGAGGDHQDPHEKKGRRHRNRHEPARRSDPDFAGSEVEPVVISALYEAFDRKTPTSAISHPTSSCTRSQIAAGPSPCRKRSPTCASGASTRARTRLLVQLAAARQRTRDCFTVPQGGDAGGWIVEPWVNRLTGRQGTRDPGPGGNLRQAITTGNYQ